MLTFSPSRKLRGVGVGVCCATAAALLPYGIASGQTTRELAKTYALNAAAPKPALLFLPGFGGSLLRLQGQGQECRLDWPGDFEPIEAKQKGKVIWGRGSIDSNELRLDLNKAVCPEPLLDFSVHFFFGLFSHTEQPYRPFWKALLQATQDRAEPEFFAYDWRKDVGDSTKRLSERLEKLKGRDVVVMTHSWGSAVIWDFLRGAYDPQKHGTIRHIVFIAPSFCGLCEILRAVQAGLPSIPEEDGKFGARLSRALFGSQLRRAFFTFPGAFEHLPATGECKQGSCPDDVLNYACLEIPPGLGGSESFRRPADFFAPEFWDGPVAAGTFFFDQKPWSSEQEKAAFFGVLDGVLATAKGFRTQFIGPVSQNVLPKWQIPVTVVYSDEYATVRKAKIPEGEYGPSEKIPLSFVFQVPGDGRVPLETARGEVHLGSTTLDFLPDDPKNPTAITEKRLTSQHGDLPNVPKFADWLNGAGDDLHHGLPEILDSVRSAAAGDAPSPGRDPKLWHLVRSYSASKSPAAEEHVDPREQLALAKTLLAEDEARSAIHALSTAQAAAAQDAPLLRDVQVALVEAFARDGRCRQARALNAKIGGEITPELKACDQGRRQKPKP